MDEHTISLAGDPFYAAAPDDEQRQELERLEERLAHELMGNEERQELRDRVLRLRRRRTDETIEAHYASLERGIPCDCYGGYHYVGHMVEDPETGGEVEVFEAVPCRRCARDER